MPKNAEFLCSSVDLCELRTPKVKTGYSRWSALLSHSVNLDLAGMFSLHTGMFSLHTGMFSLHTGIVLSPQPLTDVSSMARCVYQVTDINWEPYRP